MGVAAFPQYYIPLADVAPDVLFDEEATEATPRGEAKRYGLRVGDVVRSGAALVFGAAEVDGLDDTVRFEWSALDAWYEEDEQVFVHPRSPYSRVDAIRSTRTVRVESHGAVLAESSSPVMCFETGLPTRYYLNRTDIDFSHLVPTDTRTECPYKGITSGYWSAGDRRGARTRISPGPTTSRPATWRPSPASSPSTTRSSTSSSTVWSSSARAPTSPERRAEAAGRVVVGYLVPRTGLSTSPV